MKFIYKIILIFVIFFSSSLVAKNIEITGVNFEKKYDNILDKIYFYFFVNKKTATLLDIANIKNDHHIMCLYPSKINWEQGICDQFNANIKDHQYFEEQSLSSSQIKAYVINSYDTNFNQQILWIDKNSGKILKLDARSKSIRLDITKNINNKQERLEASYKLCHDAIHLWFNEILSEYKLITPYNLWNKPWVRIGDYIIEYKCNATDDWNAIPLLQVEHDDFDSIKTLERKKLQLNIY